MSLERHADTLPSMQHFLPACFYVQFVSGNDQIKNQGIEYLRKEAFLC